MVLGFRTDAKAALYAKALALVRSRRKSCPGLNDYSGGSQDLTGFDRDQEQHQPATHGEMPHNLKPVQDLSL